MASRNSDNNPKYSSYKRNSHAARLRKKRDARTFNVTRLISASEHADESDNLSSGTRDPFELSKETQNHAGP
jgi:hypothetical protein